MTCQSNSVWLATHTTFAFWLCLAANVTVANVALPTIFSDHMVLQREMPLPIWGWADAGEQVSVAFAGQTKSTSADEDGRWQVTLEPLTANSQPQQLTVRGSNEIAVKDVLVGEVWLCSGQSNMQWAVQQTWNADLAIAAAKFPDIRHVTVDTPGIQVPLTDFAGGWQPCTPESIGDFSAVGFYFGRQLHQILDVPIGLVDNAWGGSACEAWVRRDQLSDNLFQPYLDQWAKIEADSQHKPAYDEFEAAMIQWLQAVRIAKQQSAPIRPAPEWPQKNPLVAQHRPGNLYNGRLRPIMPFGIRGCIWYQGETNAGRAYAYRELFPLMIGNWRADWGQGEFPFYWVQLADFKAEKTEPGDSDWAELREAQTTTVDRLPKTGQAVIIDLGEGSDIHPRNKLDVAKRLARLALKNDYGLSLVDRSPHYATMRPTDNGRLQLSFGQVSDGLRTVDSRQPEGFAIAGEDRKWVWAEAEIIDKTTIEVWSAAVPNPVAVRYAWADNPVCNVFSCTGLPLTPFRTDQWPLLTEPTP